MTQAKLPPSASSFLVNFTGGVFFIAAANITFALLPEADVFTLSIVGITAALIPILLGEIFILKVHKRPGAGFLETPVAKDTERLKTKMLGYYGSLGLILLFYLFVPIYWHDEYFNPALPYFFPLLLIYGIGGPIYFSEFDHRLDRQRDGFWHFGALLMGKREEVDFNIITHHLKSLGLRAFYVPVMLTYFSIYIAFLMKGHEDFINANLTVSSEVTWYAILKFIMLIYFFLGAIDVLFGLIGYFMTFRVLDTHIRSLDPTLIGWLVCLACYYPFWEVLMIKVFFEDFYTNPEWHIWFADIPLVLVVWGGLSIVFMCTEALTTLTFGIRFSNLTYRGLITTGPFRFTKHPQYVSKMFNRFFVYVPFLSLGGPLGSLQLMVMFAGICFMYYLRARTEENHLSQYPEYVAYANWINENGIFRGVAKKFPFLIYSEEKARAGKLF